MNLQDVEQEIHSLEAKKSYLLKKKSEASEALEYATKKHKFAKEAQIILQKAGRKTQEGVEYFFANTVSQPLNTIFGDHISFGAEFVEKRGQVECEFFYKENDSKMKILDDAGGGVVDTICFALRLVLWSMNKNRHTIILDEAFKFVSKDKIHLVTAMLKQFKESLGMQFIMVTHIDEFIDNADRGFVVRDGKVQVA